MKLLLSACLLLATGCGGRLAAEASKANGDASPEPQADSTVVDTFVSNPDDETAQDAAVALDAGDTAHDAGDTAHDAGDTVHDTGDTAHDAAPSDVATAPFDATSAWDGGGPGCLGPFSAGSSCPGGLTDSPDSVTNWEWRAQCGLPAGVTLSPPETGTWWTSGPLSDCSVCSSGPHWRDGGAWPTATRCEYASDPGLDAGELFLRCSRPCSP